MKVFKRNVDVALGDMVQFWDLVGQVDLMILKVFSTLNSSMLLWREKKKKMGNYFQEILFFLVG